MTGSGAGPTGIESPGAVAPGVVVVVTGPGVAGVLRPEGKVAVEVKAGVGLAETDDGRVAADACPAEPEISPEIWFCNWLISLWPADAA